MAKAAKKKNIIPKMQRVRVLCEACLKELSKECVLCEGTKYYFWDPETKLCYYSSGEIMEVADNSGKIFSVIRHHPQEKAVENDINAMLDYIEKWATESRLRRWKLTCDDSGWRAGVWTNHLKKIGFEISDSDIRLCILKSYLRLLGSD